VERESQLAAQDPARRAEAGVLLAQLRVAQGRFAEALQVLEGVRGGAGGASVLDLAATSGDALARMNRVAEAEQAFRAELAAFPNNRDAYTKLAILYVTLDRVEDADRTLEQMFAANPTRSTAILAAETWGVLENRSAAARWKARAARFE
jgi:tetratricopeptide (TPR) repeat protein